MSEMIREIILTTRSPEGTTHIAPMGVQDVGGEVMIAPFKPSGTLSNLLRTGTAVINQTQDVRMFAGCLTGRYDWPLINTEKIEGARLLNCLAHQELKLERVEDDATRPQLFCRVVHQAVHAPFPGFNRAQAAVLELAILVSRLTWLPKEKIDTEIEYLKIAMDKTAGTDEQEAWDWLIEKIKRFQLRSYA